MDGGTHRVDKVIRANLDSDPIFQIHEYNIDVSCNHLYLFGDSEYIGTFEEPTTEPGVEYSMSSRFIKNLNILMRTSKEPILVHMKTCGGYWEEGMAIYDAIKACPNPITILNYTHVRSMSSIIFQAANKRVMMPHSIFMMHEGILEFSGTYKQATTEIEQNKLADKIMMNIYVNSMKKNGKSHC